MFRCKECQTEYEIKPDYCDCGNDTFDEIIDNVQKIKQETKTEKEKTEIKERKEIEDEPQIKQTREKREENIQIKEQISTIQNEIKQKQQLNISVFAWIIFAICIILSLIVIFLPYKKTEETVKQEENKPIQEQAIPNINTFWDNSAPKNIVPNEEKTEENATQTKELTTTNKTEKINTKTSSQKTSQQKNAKTQTKSTTKPKNTKSTTTQQKQTTPKQNVANMQEIFNYKIQLRNNIFQKIDFTTVVGDGSCSFYFKVNKDGTITNKKAGDLSDNDSLNSAVYNALLRTNSFRTPPVDFDSSAYLKLFVKFQNNSYEVSLN